MVSLALHVPTTTTTTTTTATDHTNSRRRMANKGELSSMWAAQQEKFDEAAAEKVCCLGHKLPLPRKLETSLHAASASRDGAFFLLLLLIAAIVIYQSRKRSPRRRPAEEEAPQDDGPALPGPHVDANTRMHLEDRPQTFYDWVRASNAASRPPARRG
ncbi:hypothetical protein EKO04_008030 [Ascochyta lentis]|uniref:Uncharacterized protein n=1 Tax=Ascochyta lentis TaxID=205686 RepID=A0A8H7J0E1_9PLEO|nr:hypothetical protein EKO04_008030 [Ascochyta lentis]